MIIVSQKVWNAYHENVMIITSKTFVLCLVAIMFEVISKTHAERDE